MSYPAVILQAMQKKAMRCTIRRTPPPPLPPPPVSVSPHSSPQAMLSRGLGISAGCAESVQTSLADSCTDRCCHLLEQLSQPGVVPSGPPADFSTAQPRQAQRQGQGNKVSVGRERGGGGRLVGQTQRQGQGNKVSVGWERGGGG